METVDSYCVQVVFDLCFVKASSTGSSLYGFSEYVSALALLMVIYAASEFKYKYRLSLTKIGAENFALVFSFVIGFMILLIEFWFYNHWWVPIILNDANNLRLALAAIFFCLIFFLIYTAFINPPIFGRDNAESYFRAMHHYVARGNPEHLSVIADEVGRSARNIITLAAETYPNKETLTANEPLQYPEYARYTLLLLGNRKLCREMVDKSPWTIAQLFQCSAEQIDRKLPLTQFARNVGSELVLNMNSVLYHEDDGYTSGFLGYTKPITKLVYGNFQLIEELNFEGGSPLNIDFDSKYSLTAPQLKAYARAGLLFSESYFSQSNIHHSFAFSRLLDEFEYAVGRTRGLNGHADSYWKTDEYQQLTVTVQFIRDLVDKLKPYPLPRTIRPDEYEDGINAIYDKISKLIVEVIVAASYVSEPSDTCWGIQHNAVWSKLFAFSNNRQWRIIKHKVSRLLYEEAMEMKTFPNFKAARIMGYCLNIFGPSNARRHDRSEFEGLRRLILAWLKANYLKLVEEHPNVAPACLHGSITFDVENKRIVKTYAGQLGKEPMRSYLDLVATTAE